MDNTMLYALAAQIASGAIGQMGTRPSELAKFSLDVAEEIVVQMDARTEARANAPKPTPAELTTAQAQEAQGQAAGRRAR